MDARVTRRGFLAASFVAASLGPGALAACGDQRVATRPLRGIVTRWDTDPWSLGSYSALPVGTSPTVRNTIADSVVDGGLVLAGEYASTTHPATVQGAYASGRHAANVLMADYGDIAGDTVVVIGAGVAGLAAAQRLGAAGAKVIVFEARDRIGGRIDTDTSWGVPIELGAAWVHGVRANPITRLVRSGGSSLVSTNYDDERVRNLAGGEPAGLAAARASVDRAVTHMEERAYPVAVSAHDVLRATGWIPTAINRWAVETTLTQEYGIGPERLGTAALYEGDEQVGGDALVQGGYEVVPTALAQGIDVRLSSPVRAVQGDGHGAFQITLRSGNVVAADAVVVAVPLSILQRRALVVSPLPSPVRRALDGLATGSLEKVILQYATRWWPAVQVLGCVGGPARRWAEWYDLTPVLGVPVVVGFSAGEAAAARPRSDARCIAEAAEVFEAAFG